MANKLRGLPLAGLTMVIALCLSTLIPSVAHADNIDANSDLKENVGGVIGENMGGNLYQTSDKGTLSLSHKEVTTTEQGNDSDVPKETVPGTNEGPQGNDDGGGTPAPPPGGKGTNNNGNHRSPGDPNSQKEPGARNPQNNHGGQGPQGDANQPNNSGGQKGPQNNPGGNNPGGPNGPGGPGNPGGPNGPGGTGGPGFNDHKYDKDGNPIGPLKDPKNGQQQKESILDRITRETSNAKKMANKSLKDLKEADKKSADNLRDALIRDKAMFDHAQINPRNYKRGNIETLYGTACYTETGMYAHSGYCGRAEMKDGHYNDREVTGYRITTPSYTHDNARRRDITRTTNSNRVGDAFCEPTNSETVNNITTTNTFKSMSYNFKLIENNGSVDFGGHGLYYGAYQNPQYELENIERDYRIYYETDQGVTDAWHNMGYRTESESEAHKTRTGCYYDVKMEAKSTAWFGGGMCPYSYKITLEDQRTGKVIKTIQGLSDYGKNPTHETCLNAITANINIDDLMPNAYSRYKYKNVIKYDNPKVVYSVNNDRWTLEDVFQNMTTEKRMRYSRQTCAIPWNGVGEMPFHDVVQREGKPYKLKYTQEDCLGGSDEHNPPESYVTRCVEPSSIGSGSVNVVVNSSLPPYSKDKHTVTKDDKITIQRNGVDQKITFSSPNIGVTPQYQSDMDGALPKELKIIKSQGLKNTDGTPWDSNTEVRGGVQDTQADKADFTIKRDGGSWIANIKEDPTVKQQIGGKENYYVYKLSDNQFENKISIASRWESQKDKPTILRSSYDVNGKFPYKKFYAQHVAVNGIDPGAPESKIVYNEQTLRCISGPTEIETVRSIG